MGLSSALGSLVVFLWLSGMWVAFADQCINNEHEFNRIFSVPGDVAMLNSTLLSPEVLNLTAVPYNITWYNNQTRQEMRNKTGQILVLRETLWFLNTTLEDAGEYVMILQTSFKCYMQSMRLIVDLPAVGECGRPQKATSEVNNSTSVSLNCPLEDYIKKLESYNIAPSIKWCKGCELISESDGYAYRDRTILQIYKVGPQNSGTYTCTLTFTLGGVTGSVSETIEVTITDAYSFIPRVLEPANETVKAEKGSRLTRKCQVFVPGTKNPSAGLIWLVRNNSVISDPRERIYSPEQRKWHQAKPEEGVWLERLLIISELKAEDFNINYICRVDSSRGIFRAYFTLLPADPNITFAIGFIFGGVTVLFIISVSIYYIFKIDIVLWFRRAFPLFYKNKDSDTKLYDAYVIYHQSDVCGLNEEVERFALHTLPEVLEKACGYKLFIAGRDCVPGQAIVDSVDENIQASRSVLLLYTASTFIDKTTSRNENISECSGGGDKIESMTSDTRQQLEHVAAMHSTLLEGSIKVVLVELEEISAAQLALFPESVRHLRKKQGAVCWWKNLQTRQTRRTCMRGREDEENHGKDSQLSSCLSPSSRFWKEIRFHMPVRGKRVVYPEKTSLQSFMCLS